MLRRAKWIKRNSNSLSLKTFAHLVASKKTSFAVGFLTPCHSVFAVRFLPLTLTAHFGILLASATLAACSAQPSKSTNAAPEILRWVHPEADIVSVLSEEPRECLSAQANYQETLGRLAFRSPFLLGGQAARRGLTCQACHSQGQTNTNFFVVGLSDTPGTADVTSFHFSDSLLMPKSKVVEPRRSFKIP